MARSIVEISGHIIDSLILPKVLDLVINLGGEFDILEIQIGHRRSDRSYARIQIDAETTALLDRIIARLKEHGALPVEEPAESARLEPAPADGIFPDNFYSTTNLGTAVLVNDRWLDVELTEMDCGIQVDLTSMRAACVPIHRVKKGDLIVTGHRGIKVQPIERQVPQEGFEFMSSTVSTEQPKELLIREIGRSDEKSPARQWPDSRSRRARPGAHGSRAVPRQSDRQWICPGAIRR